MPREQINYPTTHPAVVTGISPATPWNVTDEPEHGLVTYEYVEPRLHVNWLKVDDFGAGHVQLSLEVHPQDIIGRTEQATEINKRTTTVQRTDEIQTLQTETSIFHYTPSLSRDEINKLIRVLRRARDNVYGSDE